MANVDRNTAARLANALLDNSTLGTHPDLDRYIPEYKKDFYHFGAMEIRVLLDAIYGPPKPNDVMVWGQGKADSFEV